MISQMTIRMNTQMRTEWDVKFAIPDHVNLDRPQGVCQGPAVILGATAVQSRCEGLVTSVLSKPC
jgi:hypothetical protein